MYNQMPNNYLSYGQYGQAQYRPEMQQYNQMPAQPQLKGRPVSSIDEVRAAQIDFDGSLYVFPDIANQRIYTKQICADGSASLNTYCLQREVVPEKPEYVTKEEFDSVIEQLKNSLKEPKATPAASLKF